MNSRKNIENILPKRFPYKVPDGYFSAMEDELARKIKAGDEFQRNSLLAKLKPAIALAATFALIFGLGFGVMNLTKGLGRAGYAPELASEMDSIVRQEVEEASLIETLEHFYGQRQQEDTLAINIGLEEELIDDYLLSEISLVSLLSFE